MARNERVLAVPFNFQPQPGLCEKIYVIAAFLFLSDAILPHLRSQDRITGDPLYLIIFSPIYIMALLLLLSYREPILETILKSKLLFGLIMLAVLSAFWSVVPLITVRRCLALLGTTFFGIYVGLRFNLDEQIKLLAWTLGICAVSSLIMTLLIPSYGIDSEVYGSAWRGIFSHKNHLGRVMVLSTIAFLSVYTSSRRCQLAIWGMVALSLALLLLSQSVASILALSVVITLLPIFMSFRCNSSLRNSFLFLMLILGLGIMWLLFYNSGVLLDAIGRDFSMTGRIDLWKAVFCAIGERPLWGYGYDAFWEGFSGKKAYISRIAGWVPGSAHSGFLDLLLELGATGGFMFGVHYILSVRRAKKWITTEKRGSAIWPLAYLAFMALTNIAESPILRQHTLFWILYVSTTVSLSLPSMGVSPSTTVAKFRSVKKREIRWSQLGYCARN